MRYALVALLVLHGIAHLVGFAGPWLLVASAETPYRTTVLQGRVDLGEWGIRIYGLGWLTLAIGCAVVAFGVTARSTWWLVALESLILLSVIFCVLGWPESRLGVPANIVMILVAFAAIRFAGDGLAIRNPDLDELWKTGPTADGRVFDPTALSGVLPLARRFLEHAIAPGTPLARSVRLKMHGEIKLGRWYPFRAEQVITNDGQFVWAATVSMFGLPIRGSDRLFNGNGEMRWKLLDVFPVVTARGADITRSAFGRLHGEQVHWLPSTLPGGRTSWSALPSGQLRVRLEDPIRSSASDIELDSEGRARAARLSRWGDPDGKGFREVDFGVFLDQDRRFGGFTIPTRVRAGWFFGTDRFDSEGEFFRATIDHAEFK